MAGACCALESELETHARTVASRTGTHLLQCVGTASLWQHIMRCDVLQSTSLRAPVMPHVTCMSVAVAPNEVSRSALSALAQRWLITAPRRRDAAPASAPKVNETVDMPPRTEEPAFAASKRPQDDKVCRGRAALHTSIRELLASQCVMQGAPRGHVIAAYGHEGLLRMHRQSPPSMRKSPALLQGTCAHSSAAWHVRLQAKTRGASIGPGGVSVYGGSGSLSEQDRKKKADLATSRC